MNASHDARASLLLLDSRNVLCYILGSFGVQRLYYELQIANTHATRCSSNLERSRRFLVL